MVDRSIKRSDKPTDGHKKQPLGRVAKYTGVFLGIVKENRDAHKNGRLKVWIPDFASRPEDEKGTFTASWVSPFAGSTPFIDNESSIENMEGSQTSYGMWMQPPDVNNQVLITFLNGDPQWAVVFGCLFQQYMNHMVPGFAAVDEDRHHDKDTDPCSLPASEYNKKTQDEYSEGTIIRPVQHWHALGIRNAGLLKDDIRGLTTSSARREAPSQVYGITTPGPIDYRPSSKKRKSYDNDASDAGQNTARMGGHQFVMDDHPDQEHIRLRTRSGAQLLIDETNGLIYACNRDGTGWIQIDEKGRLDAWGADSASLRYEKDINIRADRDINMEAGRNINIKANRDYEENEGGSQHAGELQGDGGRITLHGNEDIHIIAHEELQAVTRTESMHFTSAEDFNATVNNTASWSTGDDYCVVVGNEMSMQVHHDVNIIVNDGDYNLSVNGDYNHHASQDNSIFAGVDNIIQAVNDTEIFAYEGKMDIGAHLDLTVKSYNGDITIEAEQGNMKLMSNDGDNQLTMRNPSVTMFSVGKVVNMSAQEVSSMVNENLEKGSGEDRSPSVGGVPLDANCIRIPDGVNVSFKTKEIDFDAIDDINTKIESGINKLEKYQGKVDTSVKKINQTLEDIEDKFNTAIKSVYDTFNDILGIDAFPLDFAIPLYLPPTPLIPDISFSLPSIELPDFAFDFCIDIGNPLSIEKFDPFPDGLFGDISIDLGGWTKRNFTNWADRQKNNFENMIPNLGDIKSQVGNSLDNEIRGFKSDLFRVKQQIDNLINVNLTDNGVYYDTYVVSARGLTNSLGAFNSTAQSQGVSNDLLSSTRALENFAGSQSRSDRAVNDRIQKTNALDNEDFSELQDVSDFLGGIIDDIDELVPGIDPVPPEPPEPPPVYDDLSVVKFNDTYVNGCRTGLFSAPLVTSDLVSSLYVTGGSGDYDITVLGCTSSGVSICSDVEYEFFDDNTQFNLRLPSVSLSTCPLALRDAIVEIKIEDLETGEELIENLVVSYELKDED